MVIGRFASSLHAGDPEYSKLWSKHYAAELALLDRLVRRLTEKLLIVYKPDTVGQLSARQLLELVQGTFMGYRARIQKAAANAANGHQSLGNAITAAQMELLADLFASPSFTHWSQLGVHVHFQGTTQFVSNLRLAEDGAKLEEVSLYMEEAFVMVPKGVKTRLDELTESASAARLVRVTNMLIYQSPGRNLAFKGDQSLQEAIKAVDRGLFFHFRMGNKHAPTVKVLTEVGATWTSRPPLCLQNTSLKAHASSVGAAVLSLPVPRDSMPKDLGNDAWATERRTWTPQRSVTIG